MVAKMDLSALHANCVPSSFFAPGMLLHRNARQNSPQANPLKADKGPDLKGNLCIAA